MVENVEILSEYLSKSIATLNHFIEEIQRFHWEFLHFYRAFFSILLGANQRAIKYSIDIW